MQASTILTALKKYRFIILLLVFIMILSGCSGNFTPVDSNSTGFFDHYFVYPFSLLIKKIASLLSGNYAISIIVITLGIRLILMPFMVKQMKQGEKSKEMMAVMKPEMEEIQAKYKKKKNTEDQMAMQKEMTELYKKHDFNPLSSMLGCLPLIIQMPILIGFYYAIRRTPEILGQPFLWFELGDTNLLFVAIAVIIYFVQSRVSLIGLDEAQRKQMAIMGLISPVMIGFISLNVPAALPLYWAVGGLFIIAQTLFVKKVVLKKK